MPNKPKLDVHSAAAPRTGSWDLGTQAELRLAAYFNEAKSMTKRYFTSPLSRRS